MRVTEPTRMPCPEPPHLTLKGVKILVADVTSADPAHARLGRYKVVESSRGMRLARSPFLPHGRVSSSRGSHALRAVAAAWRGRRPVPQGTAQILKRCHDEQAESLSH